MRKRGEGRGREVSVDATKTDQTFKVCEVTSRTTIDHDSVLLQQEVDVGVILQFSTFAEHHQDISSSIQVVF